jgi:hypothetical protein
MEYHTKLQRNKKGISLDLPVKYRYVWAARMDEVKLLVLTMSLQQVAAHFDCKMSALANAMSSHGVSANVERHKNKLRGKS